jgi:hypothetical protein
MWVEVIAQARVEPGIGRHTNVEPAYKVERVIKGKALADIDERLDRDLVLWRESG